MYKITIKETVGEAAVETIIETDDVELVKEILISKEIIKVTTDTPNQSIDPEWHTLQKIWEEAQKPPKPYNPLPPYHIGDHWIAPPNSPFTITC